METKLWIFKWANFNPLFLYVGIAPFPPLLVKTNFLDISKPVLNKRIGYSVAGFLKEGCTPHWKNVSITPQWSMSCHLLCWLHLFNRFSTCVGTLSEMAKPWRGFTECLRRMHSIVCASTWLNMIFIYYYIHFLFSNHSFQKVNGMCHCLACVFTIECDAHNFNNPSLSVSRSQDKPSVNRWLHITQNTSQTKYLAL